MKVLIATCSHNGDDDRIYYKEIVSLLDRGAEVLLTTRHRDTFDPQIPGFRHTDLAAPNLKVFGEVLLKTAVVFQPDILMIHDFELLLAGSRIKRRLGIPLVYDVHEPHRELWDLLSSKRFPARQLINWGLDRFERSFLKHVDQVLATSPTIKKRYERWRRPTAYIPNYPRLGIDYRHQPREPVIIYEGQISIARGMVQLIRAFSGVLEVQPDVRLELIGPERTPGLSERLQAFVEELGLKEKVTITGPISHEAVLQRLAEVRIGVIPFIDHPFFHAILPIKLFEYMLCGCAVLTSDLMTIRAYGEGSALLVPPGDVKALEQGLIRLLSDDAERENLARRGREKVMTEYNWQRVEPVFLKVLESLV